MNSEKILEKAIILQGEVVRGRGKARHFGFPTANLKLTNSDVLPPYGVYGGYVSVDEKVYGSVASIGLRPSADSDADPSVEAYLLNFDGDLYGRVIDLELLCYLRPIEKFDGLAELKLQIDKDIDKFNELRPLLNSSL